MEREIPQVIEETLLWVGAFISLLLVGRAIAVRPPQFSL